MCRFVQEKTTPNGSNTTEVLEASTADSPREQWTTVRRNNVADQQRSQLSDKTKENFQDILKAHKGCDNSGIDISNYSDDVNVNGSLSRESSIQFSKSLGASEPILRTLKEGHF